MLPHQRSRYTNWHLWCRLCAKIDPQDNVNVFMMYDQKDDAGKDKDGTDFSLVAAIQKYLWVKITSDEELPKSICTNCFSMVTSLVNFADCATKVQQMYHMLLNVPTSTVLDFQAIRLKYGLTDEENEEVLPVEHYVDILDKNTLKEMIALDPLAQPYIEIKIEEETLTEQNFLSETNVIKTKIECDEQTKKSYITNAISKRKVQETEKVPLELSEKRSYRKRKTKICTEKEDCKDTNVTATSDDVDVESDTTERDTSDAKSIYTCTKCPRKFKHLCSFRVHIKREHLSCPQCPEIFLSEGTLEKHLQLHIPIELRKIFSCPDCETKFSSLTAVKSHMKFIHLNECSYICEQCGKVAHTENMLKDHMLSHTDEKPYECEFCKKSFKCPRRLKKHTQQYHDNKDHICTECGLQLSCPITLKRHMLVHSDELKFRCDYCGRAFKRSKTLKMHLILHTGLKPYSCDFCDRTFTNGSNCRTHKRKSHPEELAKQEAAGGTKTFTKNIPKLKALRAVTQTSNNLLPVVSKSSGNFACKKRQNLKTDDTQTNILCFEFNK